MRPAGPHLRRLRRPSVGPREGQQVAADGAVAGVVPRRVASVAAMTSRFRCGRNRQRRRISRVATL